MLFVNFSGGYKYSVFVHFASMESLNLPEYLFTISEKNGKQYIFDEIRKKYLLLTPEEWVRQNFIKYLVVNKLYPASLLSLEKSFLQNKSNRRTDIVVMNSQGKPLMLVECKASSVQLSQQVFDQTASYNREVNALILVVTNGLKHYCFRSNFEQRKWDFLSEIPTYLDLKSLWVEKL